MKSIIYALCLTLVVAAIMDGTVQRLYVDMSCSPYHTPNHMIMMRCRSGRTSRSQRRKELLD